VTETWEGRQALVTGASRGIGAAVATRLAELDADLLLTGRDVQALHTVAEGCAEAGAGRVEVVAADLLEEELSPALTSAVDALPRLDLLANVAGSALSSARLEELHPGDWEDSLRLNLLSVVHLQQRCLAALTAADGVIVNVGSVAASRASSRGAAYAAAKAGLASLTRSTAIEWARYGVRAICVEPGFVDTDFNRELKDAGLEQRLLAKVPTGRAISADAVAELLIALAAPGLADLTGEVVRFDGGWSAKL
jgi:3-oxoacyl-[acyl-carrier protein] reductase